MVKLWQSLEAIPVAAAVAAEWQSWTGELFPAFKTAFLQAGDKPAASFPCPRECGCQHRVVPHDSGQIVAVCDCDPCNCEDISLTRDDVVMWHINRAKFGRAVAKAFDCDAKDADLRIPGTRQVASFGGAALPVVLTIQHDRASFTSAVGQLVATLKERFILLAPTSQFADANSLGLLKSAKAGFFDLESHLILQPGGNLQARKSGGVLFSPYLPTASEPASDDEARRLFALLKALESESNYRKAPVTRVFQLYCLESKSRNAVATACRCVPSLVTLRLKAIEKKLGRKPRELRSLSDQFERIADSLTDSRARRIDRGRAIDGDDPDNED